MFDDRLNKYLIPGALDFLNKWCTGYALQLKIKNARESKLGDYRRFHNVHQITLNCNMPPELTFFTLTHEIAHMHAREKFGPSIKPHGKEWKLTFANLILETIHLYPDDLQTTLRVFAQNPKASYYAFAPLAAYFQQINNDDKVILKDVPLHARFRIRNKIFEKGNLRKIRYLCTEISTGKKYTIHHLAPVDEVYLD